MKICNTKNFNWSIGDDKKLAVIAGCNVIESLDECLNIGLHLKKICHDLDINFCFKASFDKANRSSIKSFRGPGITDGLKILTKIKEELNVPICTDIHEANQSDTVSQVADIIQIPAFLCRQTDLIIKAAESSKKYGSILHIKKAQFLAPWDCKNILNKIYEVHSDAKVIFCERGVSFGYNNLIVDPLSITILKELNVPVTIDATHAVQLPGANPLTDGASTGGRRWGVPIIAKSCIAAGAQGVFLEFHTNPDKALCDAPSCLDINDAYDLLSTLVGIYSAVNNT